MSFLSYLFKKAQQPEEKKEVSNDTSGEFVTVATGGANLVDGKQTWELAKEKKR